MALSLWRRLGLTRLLNQLIPSGREEVSWERTACLLTLARFCAQPSELGSKTLTCPRCGAQRGHSCRRCCVKTGTRSGHQDVPVVDVIIKKAEEV